MAPHHRTAAHHGDPFFRVCCPDSLLSRRDLEELAAGRTAAVHVREVIDKDRCAHFMSFFDSALMNHYDAKRYALPAARFGPVLNEFNTTRGVADDYWRYAGKAEEYWYGLDEEADVRSACRRFLAAAWKTGVETAAIEDRSLFWGIVREINTGTLIHWDEFVREYPSTALQEIPIVQLACNVFVSVPDRGGETCVWRHRWQPRDERHRLGFGYDPTAVGACPRIEIAPRVGDAVFFDSRNYHRVRPSSGGRRVSLSFFVGMTAGGHLLMWS